MVRKMAASRRALSKLVTVAWKSDVSAKLPVLLDKLAGCGMRLLTNFTLGADIWAGDMGDKSIAMMANKNIFVVGQFFITVLFS